MGDGDAALDGHALVALRHAAKAIVGYERDIAGDGDRLGRRFFLRESRCGRAAKHGRDKVLLHAGIPLSSRIFPPAVGKCGPLIPGWVVGRGTLLSDLQHAS